VLRPDYADPAVLAFVVIPCLLAVAFVAGVWWAWRRTTPASAPRAAALAIVLTPAWMAITWQAAASGVLRQWDAMPPPFALLVVTILLLALRIGWGGVGSRMAATFPLWLLVAVQGFRLPLELAMHRMYEQGIMPVQMSYSGLNYDIVTGILALVVAALVYTGRAGYRLVRLWNVVGLLLLINVVTVAILATPRIRYFGDFALNTWVMYPPFVWLPAVMVLAAFAGHLIVFQALRHITRAGSSGRHPRGSGASA
jgi:hypothetical protein